VKVSEQVESMKITDHLYLAGSGAMGLSHAFDCHVYVLDCGGDLVMIDSGAGESPERILTNMAEDGLDYRNLKAILLTHCHADHSGGSAFLKGKTGAIIYLSEEEKGILESGTAESVGLDIAIRAGIYSPEYQLKNCAVDIALGDTEALEFGGWRIEPYKVPSHSPGSICYLVELPDGRRTLFSGDVVFIDGVISVLNIEGSELSGYRKNLPRLSDLGIDALMPGHGLFCLEGGQRHIDLAIESLRLLKTPKNLL
jgi:glyoxylase-like metal-dependent hydrolase (beta-lactamase superfamily II)